MSSSTRPLPGHARSSAPRPARTQALGAEVVQALEETDHGSRGFSILDQAGNGWSFGTYAG